VLEGTRTIQVELFDFMNGWHYSDTGAYVSTSYSWMFKRAKGFFDVVAYTGNGIAGRTVNHNLGVVPEMIWVKSRSRASTVWSVYHKDLQSNLYLLELQSANGEAYQGTSRIYDYPDLDYIYLGNSQNVNLNTETYIAYLFATLAGISKVGSYTGNGTSQTIDAGFSTGAKFFMAKRTEYYGELDILGQHTWNCCRYRKLLNFEYHSSRGHNRRCCRPSKCRYNDK
jgi:hypothetical protein